MSPVFRISTQEKVPPGGFLLMKSFSIKGMVYLPILTNNKGLNTHGTATLHFQPVDAP